MEANRAAWKSLLCGAICFLTSYLEHVICCLFFSRLNSIPTSLCVKAFHSCKIGPLKSQWNADVFCTAKFCSYTENSLK